MPRRLTRLAVTYDGVDATAVLRPLSPAARLVQAWLAWEQGRVDDTMQELRALAGVPDPTPTRRLALNARWQGVWGRAWGYRQEGASASSSSEVVTDSP